MNVPLGPIPVHGNYPLMIEGGLPHDLRAPDWEEGSDMNASLFLERVEGFFLSESAPIGDVVEEVTVSSFAVPLLKGIHFLFFASLSMTYVVNSLLLFSDEEQWRENLCCQDLPDEIFAMSQRAEGAAIIKNSIAASVCLVNLSAVVLGYVVAFPLLLFFSCAEIVVHIAAYVMKEAAESRRSAYCVVSLGERSIIALPSLTRGQE